MKKVIIAKTSHDGKSPGDFIFNPMDESELVNYRHWRMDNDWEVVDLHDELSDMETLKSTQASEDCWYRPGQALATSEPTFSVDTWIKAGESDETTDPLDNTYTAYLAGDNDPRYKAVLNGEWYIEVDAQKDKSKRISAEGSTLSSGVYSDLQNTFGTQKTEVATAWYLTALAMKDDPAFFSSSGLEVEVATTTFAVGDALDTDQKVTDYSNELAASAKQYGLDRMLKYKTYRANKTSIENE